MVAGREEEFLAAAAAALSPSELALLEELHRFTADRLLAASRKLGEILAALEGDAEPAAKGESLHAFLREAWEALDGLARQVNLCLVRRLPEAKLYPPERMTRQCTFYMVRKKLHEHPATSEHPVSRLLWGATKSRPGGPYASLSFLYNLSVFLPIPIVEGRRLPGSDDIPAFARPLLKVQEMESSPIDSALTAIYRWLEGFAAECYSLLREELAKGDSHLF